MSNNSTNLTSPIACPLLASDTNRQSINRLSDFTYFYFKPIALLLDIIGHVLCFLALHKKRKQNTSYSFQFYETAAKCMDTFGATFNLFFYQWFAGIGGTDGAYWFRSNYTLIWIGAKFGISLYDTMSTIKLLATLAMSLDRCFAVSEPVAYRNLTAHRNRMERTSLCVIFGLGIGVSAYGVFYYVPEFDPVLNLYSIKQNSAFVNSSTCTILMMIRTGVYALAMLIIVYCGMKMIRLQHARNVKISEMTTSNAETTREKHRRATEKSLLVLTIFKSCQVTNEFVIKLVQTNLNSFKPGFVTCQNTLLSPIRHIEIALINTLDFYVMIVISKKFRGMIKDVLTGG